MFTEFKLLSISLLLCLISACSVNLVNQCPDGVNRDLAGYYGELDKIVVANKRLTQKVIGTVHHAGKQNEIRVVSYQTKKPTRLNVFISGGVHGDEPASVSSVLEYLRNIDQHLAKYQGVSVELIPVVNPSGWRRCERLTGASVDVNRQFEQSDDDEIAIVKRYLEDRHYDLMIDRHEDPRAHVHAFYIVTYGNNNIVAMKQAVKKVKSLGFPIRKFSKTKGYLSYQERRLTKLKQRTFTLYSRLHELSGSVYQIETPTEFKYKDRVKLQNLTTNILISGALAEK